MNSTPFSSISFEPSKVKCTGILPSTVLLSCSWIIVDTFAPKLDNGCNILTNCPGVSGTSINNFNI